MSVDQLMCVIIASGESIGGGKEYFLSVIRVRKE